MPQKGMLVDITRCEGCGECVAACKEANDLPIQDPPETTLSASSYCVLQEHGEHWVRRLCMHCLEPACASVCPVGALVKSAEGPVLWDEARCIGCRYCMVACAFDVPRYEWGSANPRLRKCVFCAERQRKGEPPACADACPAEATVYGDRDALLRDAHARLAERPDDYYPEIYGEHTVGGTSMLFLSPVPFETLGFPAKLGTAPLPELTKAVLAKIPGALVVGGAFLLGMTWLTRRKNEIAAESRPGRERGDR